MAGTKMVQVVAALSCSLVLMLALGAGFSSAQNTLEVSTICNGSPVPDAESQQAVTDAIRDAVKHTSDPGYYYKAFKSYSQRPGYAVGACNGALSKSECDTCMSMADFKLDLYCREPSSIYKKGGQIKLVDCRLRFELYDFNF
ncbi:hypothetical protein R1flu_015085 [Riccia fluitans]|uniref:Gnk2-homologous domain-containing protein n=1 Tax=Riccia fluitans TaxID=41844 RepID=A0ABD1YL88_9MARC